MTSREKDTSHRTPYQFRHESGKTESDCHALDNLDQKSSLNIPKYSEATRMVILEKKATELKSDPEESFFILLRAKSVKVSECTPDHRLADEQRNKTIREKPSKQPESQENPQKGVSPPLKREQGGKTARMLGQPMELLSKSSWLLG